MEEADRRMRQYSIAERLDNLKSTPPMFLPQGTVLKEFVRSLQRDLKTEGDELLEEGEYYKAGLLFTEALTMNKYLRNQGYERDWSFDKRVYLARAECGIGMEVFSASIDDCDAVLTNEKDNLRAMVIQTVAEFEEMLKLSTSNGPLQSELWEFERKLERKPERVRKHPRGEKVIERLFAMPGMQTDVGRKAKQRLTSLVEAAAAPDPPQGVDSEWLPDHVKAAAKTAAKQKSKPSKKKQKSSQQFQATTSPYSTNTGNDIYQSDSDRDFSDIEQDDDVDEDESDSTDSTCHDSLLTNDAQGNWETIGKGKKKIGEPLGKPSPAKIGSALNELDDFDDLSLDVHLKPAVVVKTAPSTHNNSNSSSSHHAPPKQNHTKPKVSTSTFVPVGKPKQPQAKAPPAAAKQPPVKATALPEIGEPLGKPSPAKIGSALNELDDFDDLSLDVHLKPAAVVKTAPSTHNNSNSSSSHHAPPKQNHTKPKVSTSTFVPVGKPKQPQAKVPPAAAKQPPVKATALPQVSQVTREWLNRILFRLACQHCYIDIPGKYGFHRHKYLKDKRHPCRGGYLVARLDSCKGILQEEMWGRVRQRPKLDFKGCYTICQQFTSGVSCKIMEEKCWFCHSQEEMIVWEADRKGQFTGPEIVTYLRALQGIGMSKQAKEPVQLKPQPSPFTLYPPMPTLTTLFQSSNKAFGVQDAQGFQGQQQVNEPKSLIGQPVQVQLFSMNGGDSKQTVGLAPVGLHPTSKTTNSGPLPKVTKPAAATPVFSQAAGTLDEKTKKAILGLMSTIQGQFIYLCQACFDGAPPCTSTKAAGSNYCSNEDKPHYWVKNRTLVHVYAENGKYRYWKIRQRPNGIPARALLCWHREKRFGCIAGNGCKFGHNAVEVEVWEFEVFNIVSRDDLVQYCTEAARVQAAAPVLSGVAMAPLTPTIPSTASTSSITQKKQILIPPFRFLMKLVCDFCFDRKLQVEQNKKNPSKCSGNNPHDWLKPVCLLWSPTRKRWHRVYPRHPKLKPDIKPYLCRHGERCDIRGIYSMPCMFPHIPEEVELWNYMGEHKLQTLEEVFDIIKKNKQTGVAASVVVNSASSRPVMPSPTVRPLPTQVLHLNKYYCSYCNQAFPQMWRLEMHMNHPEHKARINSDKERSWKYRSPPWNVLNGDYGLCQKNLRNRCLYSETSQEKNNCTNAHSMEELEEWKERHEYRMMKMKKARDQKLYSFMDELLTKYNFSTSEMSVMADELPNIRVYGKDELNPFLSATDERKGAEPFTYTWRFEIKTMKQKSLKRVGLLYDEHRLHFYLSSPSEEDKPQVCPGKMISKGGDMENYAINVIFHSQMLGSFHQWVVFDFGSEPVLVRKLSIHVGSEKDLGKYTAIKKRKEIITWDSSNCRIERYNAVNQDEEVLYAKYKPPASLSIDDIAEEQLNKENYKHYMHKMLFLEELECMKRISRYSGETTMAISGQITVEGFTGTVLLPSREGLFGKINLSQTLCDDSEASQIVLSSVQFVLIKFDAAAPVAHQAEIIADHEKDGRTEDHVYVRLNESCVCNNKLVEHLNSEVQVHVQFQLDRLPFCDMHYAVDKLKTMDMLFPPPRQPPRFPHVRKADLLKMNPRQEGASRFITNYGGPVMSQQPHFHGIVGPVLIYGPFGTGKTHTLARSVLRTLETRRPDTRILICTHSNSAADWYITEHLQPLLKETNNKSCRMVRIYYNRRNMSTIDSNVIPCVLQDNNNMPRYPTRSEMNNYNVVITTLRTAMVLTHLNLEGFFTHIFIDEAGQALETEAIIPLTMATRDTCVVLAGDHIQMSPKVYCETARIANFHMSLLERLQDYSWRNQCQLDLLLTFNYRTRPEILEFISETHYKVKLDAKGDHPRHPELYPLMFCTVKGEDQLLGTSYVNNYEVLEIAYRIETLCRTWPPEWGEMDKSSICVMTPYSFQVRQLRRELRRRHLNQVIVETVQNVQGKEFRCVYISTVRTRSTLNKAHITAIDHKEINRQDGEYYYGFLSDIKLLNTAFTRAQSLLVVVGDPVALCSVGSCSQTWKSYVLECEKHDSLYPKDTSVDRIQQEIMAAKQRLNPFAKSFKPSKEPQRLLQSALMQPSAAATKPLFSVWDNKNNPWGASAAQPSKPNPDGYKRMLSEEYPALPDKRVEDGDDNDETNSWIFEADEEDDDINDAILQELRRQVLFDRKEIEDSIQEDSSSGIEMSLSQADYSASSEGLTQESNFELNAEMEEELKRIEVVSVPKLVTSIPSVHKPQIQRQVSEGKPQFRMVQSGNQILLLQDNYKPSNLQGADYFDEYDSDDDDQMADNTDGSARDQYKKLSQEQPDRFKVCIFRYDISGRIYAIPKDSGSADEIQITSKKRRGQALDCDEVIIEILEDEDELETTGDIEAISVANKEIKIYGKVVHILKRATDPRLRKIVCTLDPFTDNLMVPIDRTFPKLYAMSRKDKKTRKKVGKHLKTSEMVTVSVYSIKQGKSFDYDRNVIVTNKERPNKLFVVQYWWWYEKTPYPLGIVTELLPPGDNPHDGMHILKLVHSIKEKWKSSVESYVQEKFPDNWKIPEAELNQREDMRNKMVFTVDPPESKDLDDAISIEELADERFVVGIHIADVSYFVEKESLLDSEVKAKATSYYPSFAKPIHMLPPQLSTRLCSLLPEADRLTISVFITLDQRGNIVDNARIVKSVICSHIQLSYEDVEKVINIEDRACVPGIPEQILMLHRLAKERRRDRLGDGRFAYSHEDDEIEVSYPQAHSMVEEMMILANLTVAKFLINKFPQCTMLRRQLKPDKENLQEWIDKHHRDIRNSISLAARGLLQSTQATGNENDPITNHTVSLLKETWHKLQSSVQSDDNNMNKISDIACTDQNHPQLAVTHAKFYHLMAKADYVCSGDYPAQDKHGHYSLSMTEYTHFTSPIRRYSDLIVHRMLVSAMDGETTSPYTQEEMGLLCHHCTAQSLNAQSFEMKTKALQLALKLKEAPLPLLSIVENVSDTNVVLLFPRKRYIQSNKRSVGLRLLKPIKKPEVDEVACSLSLKWKQRVYDRLGYLKSRVPPNAQQELETTRFTVQVPERQWNEILTGIKTDDIYQIQSAIEVTRNDVEHAERETKANRSHTNRQLGLNEPFVVDEVISESVNNNQSKYSLFVEFQRKYQPSDVVQIQMHSTLQKGILGPSIQLFNMTPHLDFCTEHRAEPVGCFAKVATKRPLNIKNISKYKEVWLPIIEMLNAHNAVHSDETVIIHGVEIQWQRHFMEETKDYTYQGSFQLPQDFCEARHIQFSYPRKYNKEEGNNKDFHLDYMCIRYSNLEIPHHIQLQLQTLDQKPGASRPRDHTPHPGKMTFVVHAATTDVQVDKKCKLVVVQFEVNQFSSPFPNVLLGHLDDDVPVCTLELIPKTEPDRRLEEAVRQLDKATPLIRDICLLQKPRTTGTDDSIAKHLLSSAKSIRVLEIPGCPLSRPNESQQEALRNALDQPFTIIQGPPGTGKTVTGAYLAYFFTKMNKKLPPMGKGQPQVLYCGPSNKSVDVIAEYLKKLNVTIVRVYSETIERKEFPIPGVSTATRKLGSGREAGMDDKHKDISLHHLIRKPTNSFHEAIKNYDEMFRMQGYRASYSDVYDYKRTVSAAEEQELKKKQIILCTCNASGSKRIRDFTTIIQCIVDEAGMCNEPETLIPLVNTKPSQVVLIGDHQQLRPIIQESTAQLLGMEISLLEKYKQRARMLKIQYRMHESICEFPSASFYNGELVTADIIKRRRPDPPGMNIWPGGDLRPTVFCHVYGREESLTVKTAEGNEKSRCNSQEVYHSVRIATILVSRFKVKPENIIVMSQYRLQCSEIEKELVRKGYREIKVTTVITSQGSEWDYVVMSTVRSLPRIEIEDKPGTGWKLRHLGSILDENQMNVALTRAKRGLIIVGNQYLLQTHDLWNDLLSSYRQHGCVVEARSFPRVR